MACRRELLVDTPEHGIVRCGCGTYFLRIGEASFRLPAERVGRLAQDLTMALAGLGAAGRGRERPENACSN